MIKMFSDVQRPRLETSFEGNEALNILKPSSKCDIEIKL